MMHGRYSFVTFDKTLYNKARMLQWTRTDECKDLIIILRGFHTQMTFSKVTEKYMESSGLSDICVESEVLGKTNVMNTLKGTPVELWPLFLTWAKENAKDLGGSLKDLTQRLAEGYSTGQNEDRFDAYVALTESLSKFPDSLRILVQHTRVTRTGKSSVLNNTESGINLHDIRVTTTLTECNYNITPILR